MHHTMRSAAAPFSGFDHTKHFAIRGICATMNRREWAKARLAIGLLMLAILFAQSRRNCEIPGSTWIPCIWGKALKHPEEQSPGMGLRFE